MNSCLAWELRNVELLVEFGKRERRNIISYFDLIPALFAVITGQDERFLIFPSLNVLQSKKWQAQTNVHQDEEDDQVFIYLWFVCSRQLLMGRMVWSADDSPLLRGFQETLRGKGVLYSHSIERS